MNNLQVTRQLYLDCVPTAELIEAQMGAYLLPPEAGLYLPGRVRPVMRPNQYYFQWKSTSAGRRQAQAVLSAADIKGDVYDENAVKVISKDAVKLISETPTLPVRGLEVIYSAVDQTLRRLSLWSGKAVGPLGAFVADHLKEEYRQVLPAEEDNENFLQHLASDARNPERRTNTQALLERLKRNTDIRAQLTELVGDLCYDVEQFVGKDKWVMHFHHAHGPDVVVDKTIDFRIFDWERRMASGEWQ